MTAYEMKSSSRADANELDRASDEAVESSKEGMAGTHNSGSTQTRVRRIFSFTQLYFFALSYMQSWEAITTNVGLAFYNGGPRALVWGFFIVVPGVLCQAASIAELASVQPIAGAQYHWTWQFAPPSARKFVTWLQGWITWFSWIALLAGVTNIASNCMMVIVVANHPDYVVKGWHTILVMYGFLVALGLLNMYGFWLIPWIELVAGLLHVVLWIVYAVVLLTLAPRHSSEFVFLEKANASGWTSDFVSFNLGIILLSWGFVGYDAMAHISEETKKARSAVPKAMFWSLCVNAAMAFGMVIILLYTLGNTKEIASSSYPLMNICLNATKSVAGASAMLAGILITIISGTIGSVASVSRLTWAWARDGALPQYFAYVDPKYRIPLRSVWLPIILVMLLSLLNLANYTAFSVITSLSTFGLFQSYLIAIVCGLIAKLQGRFHEAPWSLGKFGIPINIFAIAFTVWLGIFMTFPTYLPITASLFNYALPINAFVWLFAIVSYVAWGRARWQGLDSDVIDKVLADSDRDTKD
ncbi:hypothetical protein CERZMDRAFT_63866 [Cercospora zeae-maydis SCOH1-5]|uniref:Amino acid permease/ SLC12A domain-containing protein n=1 Tax=Cercospora zeae-maydis SCOH1-5 TaxID=717836 RepID=A0A6A6FWG2_9PEZI|nr:hypothetical protein CERZMDRAFT_63866 [Cercospora zeae-maydis SCOH1-5]